MSIAHRIPFGVETDGEVVDALGVQRGLACNCLCPGCKQPLMAKQGDIRVHHFSHLGDRSCTNGQVMALTMAAKQVLAREKRMALPDLVATVEHATRYGLKRRNSLRAAQGTWKFNAVEIDQAGQRSKADVACTTADGTTMYVAIRVPEQSGGALVPEGRLNPGTLHTISMGTSEMPGIYRLEIQSIPGSGKANVSGVAPREAVRVAFDYFKANSSRVSASIKLEERDFHTHLVELQNSGARLAFTEASFIALCSAALVKPVQSQLAVMGDTSLGGTVVQARNLAQCM